MRRPRNCRDWTPGGKPSHCSTSCAALGAPTALGDYGFTKADIPEAVTRILKAAPASNPTPVTEANITALLGAALTGSIPAVAAPVNA